MQSSEPSGDKICLCLSGGGFRATLFHLGVIDRLRRLNVLGRISHIIGISGGAIAAAILHNHWNLVASDDSNTINQFHDVIFSFMGRNQILRAAVSAGLRNDYLQVGFARRLERLKTALDLLGPMPKEGERPLAYAVASSLSTKEQIAFELNTHKYYTLRLSDNAASVVKGDAGTGAADDWPMAVMHSASFPVVFPPQHVTMMDRNRYLADGGLLDNLGVWGAAALCEKTNTVIISDASTFRFAVDPVNENLATTISGALRCIDYLMDNAAQLSTRTLLIGRAKHVLSLNSASSVFDQSRAATVCQIRTNLDRFDARECLLLHEAGYKIAERELKLGLDEVSSQHAIFTAGYKFEGETFGNAETTKSGGPPRAPWRLVLFDRLDRLVSKPTSLLLLVVVFALTLALVSFSGGLLSGILWGAR